MQYAKGDILLVKKRVGLVGIGQGTVQFFKYITVLPLMVSLGRNGGVKGAGIHNAGYSHALVFHSNSEGWAHSTSAGTVVGLWEPLAGDVVFRCDSTDKAKLAAETGKTWASAGGSKYNTRKSFLSAFGSSNFGGDAKKRAALYREHRTRLGGPPGHSGDGNKTWFCSMFAIACWQAVMNDDAQTREFMELDARNSTPMTLGTYLANNPHWTEHTV